MTTLVRIFILALPVVYFWFLGSAILAQQHVHPEILPTDIATWNSCCHNRDCHEAAIQTMVLNQSTTLVKVNDYPSFTMPAANIMPSMNGRAYYCRPDINRPPSTDNIRCVFTAGGGYN